VCEIPGNRRYMEHYTLGLCAWQTCGHRIGARGNDENRASRVRLAGEGADSQSLLFALMTEAGHRGNQPLHLLANMTRHPAAALRAARIPGWSRRTMVLLVMQSLDNAMRPKVKRRWPTETWS
jgi:hypothetical protein